MLENVEGVSYFMGCLNKKQRFQGLDMILWIENVMNYGVGMIILKQIVTMRLSILNLIHALRVCLEK